MGRGEISGPLFFGHSHVGKNEHIGFVVSDRFHDKAVKRMGTYRLGVRREESNGAKAALHQSTSKRAYIAEG
jgi:hypothetical protein